MDIIPSVIDRLEKSYINAFKLGASNGNPATFKNDEKKQEFKEQFKALCELNQAKDEEMAMIRDFKCSSVDDFDQDYKTKLFELRKHSHFNNQRYNRFAEEIDNIVILDESEEATDVNSETVDGDMAVKETQLFIDPISKMQIRDPVKNTICGHIYERSIILEAIRLNKRTKCAYMGCSNKRAVLEENLRDDYDLKAKLDKLFTQKEKLMDEDED